MLPLPLLPISHIGFLYLTLLLCRQLGGRRQGPDPARRFGLSRTDPRSTGLSRTDRLYRSLGAATVVAELIWMSGLSQLRSVGIGLLALFSLFMAWSLVRLVRALAAEQRIDERLISGAAAGYLLLGLSGGLVLTVLDSIQPGGFHDNLSNSILQLAGRDGGVVDSRAWYDDFSRLNYFAFVSLTTVGYGDITPITPLTRLASLALSVLGPLYIAVVLGVLISRLSSGGAAPAAGAGEGAEARTAPAQSPAAERDSGGSGPSAAS